MAIEVLVPKGITLQPLDIATIQSWVRRTEIDFLNALCIFGDSLPKPRGRKLVYDDDTPSVDVGCFVGAHLCEEASQAFIQALLQKFGRNATAFFAVGIVENKNLGPNTLQSNAGFPTMPHTWVRITGNDGNDYTIDPTYGQINRRLNRVVFYNAQNDRHYYGHHEKPVIRTELPLRDPLPSNNPMIRALLG